MMVRLIGRDQVLAAQIVGPWLAKDLVAAYLSAKFSTEEEFRRRVAKLADMDAGR